MYARIVISGMVKVVTDARSQQYANVLSRQLLPEFTKVHESVHHLTDAEAMPEVVKRIVAVVFLYAQLQQQAFECL
jgi:hypothetical protein